MIQNDTRLDSPFMQVAVLLCVFATCCDCVKLTYGGLRLRQNITGSCSSIENTLKKPASSGLFHCYPISTKRAHAIRQCELPGQHRLCNDYNSFTRCPSRVIRPYIGQSNTLIQSRIAPHRFSQPA